MSEVGFSELIILFLIGLIVLGPERLPRVANQLGTWLGQARRMTRVMKRQLEEELDLENRPPSIKPPRLPSSVGAAAASGAPHDDDTYSPLHDALETEDDIAAAEAAPGDEPVAPSDDGADAAADASDSDAKKQA